MVSQKSDQNLQYLELKYFFLVNLDFCKTNEWIKVEKLLWNLLTFRDKSPLTRSKDNWFQIRFPSMHFLNYFKNLRVLCSLNFNILSLRNHLRNLVRIYSFSNYINGNVSNILWLSYNGMQFQDFTCKNLWILL